MTLFFRTLFIYHVIFLSCQYLHLSKNLNIKLSEIEIYFIHHCHYVQIPASSLSSSLSLSNPRCLSISFESSQSLYKGQLTCSSFFVKMANFSLSSQPTSISIIISRPPIARGDHFLLSDLTFSVILAP